MGFQEDMDEMVPERIIHSVTFDHTDGSVEIAFAELRDQAEGVGMVKVAAAERELFHAEIVELETDLNDLVDELLIAIRNEDARKARIEKARLRFSKKDEEEDDDEE